MYTLHRQVGNCSAWCSKPKSNRQSAFSDGGAGANGLKDPKVDMLRSQKCRNVSQDTEFSHAGHSSSMGPNGDQKLGV